MAMQVSWRTFESGLFLGASAHLWNSFHVLCDQASFFPAMIPLQVARELGVDGQRWLYTDDHIACLVRNPSD